MKKVALVCCSKKKLAAPASAVAMYVSPLFKKSFELASMGPFDDVLILSAKHGILDPDTKIEPYDVTLKGMNRSEYCEWASRVTMQLQERYLRRGESLLFGDIEFVVFGGEAYWCLLRTSIKAVCAWPSGLKGIGGIMHWLDEQMRVIEEGKRGPLDAE